MTVPFQGSGTMSGMIPILINCFQVTVAPPSSAALSEAEATLTQQSTAAGYVVRTLEIVGMDTVDESVKLAAALNFKNTVKANWQVAEGETPNIHIQDSEKEQIKQFLFTVVLTSSSAIRKQLNEALSLIAASDFPHRWQALLPELVQSLGPGSPGTKIAVLDAMSSIFQPFRRSTIEESNDTLAYCQTTAAEAVLKTAEAAGEAAGHAAGKHDVLKQLCEIVRLSNEIVFSLNVYGLSIHMEKYAERWMKVWKAWLEFHDDSLKEEDSDVESAEDAVKAQVVQCCHQFLEMQEEDIQAYLSTFMTTIWGLLVSCSSKSGQDNLALAAISFLTTVCRSTHHKLFASGDTIKQICEGIIIPNVRFRDEDEEAFESNYIEFLRRDLEGSDTDTRRRAACDFVRCLADRFPAETTQIITSYTTQLLQQYAENPAENWITKDIALYMVMALAVKGKTAAAGATTVNSLVDINAFFQQHIVSELTTADINERPVLKADSLRFEASPHLAYAALRWQNVMQGC
eukprot:jgi/Ulvmu1/5214/UM022_0007.1